LKTIIFNIGEGWPAKALISSAAYVEKNNNAAVV
jgi:hypothetical protein